MWHRCSCSNRGLAGTGTERGHTIHSAAKRPSHVPLVHPENDVIGRYVSDTVENGKKVAGYMGLACLDA